jgi:hypothetical protein
MLLGAASPDERPSSGSGIRIPLITALVLLAGLGLTVWPIQTLLTAAAQAGR